MNRSCITEALDAMETAYEYILLNVAPGTPGKVEAVTELRHNVNRMVFEFAHKDRPITSPALSFDYTVGAIK